MEQRSLELDSFEELVKKTKDVEAKTALQTCSYIRVIDQHYLQGNRYEREKAKIGLWKDPRIENPKSHTQEAKTAVSQSAAPQLLSSKDLNKTQKQKKKNR